MSSNAARCVTFAELQRPLDRDCLLQRGVCEPRSLLRPPKAGRRPFGHVGHRIAGPPPSQLTAPSSGASYLEQGRRAEARELLAPVYGWFTEGFGTADLKEAKALLDALA
jgi:hypothetical protein